MSNKDFQNGFALGLVSGGTSEPTTALKANSSVNSVILPVTLDTAKIQINNKTITVDSSVTLEE